jgi:hypothetical protein
MFNCLQAKGNILYRFLQRYPWSERNYISTPEDIAVQSFVNKERVVKITVLKSVPLGSVPIVTLSGFASISAGIIRVYITANAKE